eukprot:2226338-Rhodomonas_salina.1
MQERAGGEGGVKGRITSAACSFPKFVRLPPHFTTTSSSVQCPFSPAGASVFSGTANRRISVTANRRKHFYQYREPKYREPAHFSTGLA